MTADHPTREERYAATVLPFIRKVCTCHLFSSDREPHNVGCETLVNAHRLAAALVAADPAPAQPDAGLSDDERADLLRAWPWPREAATTAAGFADVVAAVECILAARAAQPVPAPEVSRGGFAKGGFSGQRVTIHLDDRECIIGPNLRCQRTDEAHMPHHAHPADDGADCCRERTTAGGCGCGGGS